MTIKTLTKTDNAVRETTVAGETVRTIRTVKPDKDATDRYVTDWTFDFQNVTHDELMTLAVRATVIDTQRVWRAAKDRMSDAWGVRTISVREMLDAERKAGGAADPATRAKNAIGKMSDAEKAELLKFLQSAVK